MSKTNSADIGIRTRRDAPLVKKAEVQQCPLCDSRPVDGFDAIQGKATCRPCASVSGTGWFVRARTLVEAIGEGDNE